MAKRELQEGTQPIQTADFSHSPNNLPQKRGGCGCWITGAATLLTVAALIVVGLMLPPVNLYDRLFGTQYAMLTSEANATANDGLTLIVDPQDAGSEFGVALDNIPLQTFLTGNTSAGAWVPEAIAAQPINAALQSPVYSIETTGTAPEVVTLSLDAPSSVTSDVLDVYAWDTQNAVWSFVPSHASADGKITASLRDVPDHIALFQSNPSDQPRVLAAVDVTQVLSPDVAQIATIVSPAGLQPTLEGTLAGSLAAGFELNAGYLVIPVIRNFADPRAIDTSTVEAILGNSALRSRHAAQVASFASSGYGGVLIDYRDLPVSQRANFSAFITELGRLTDSAGVQLGVVVPSAVNNAGSWETGAYDWRAIGAAADFVQINLPIDPSAYTPGADRVIEAMLRWAVGEIERGKLLMGLSAQSARQINGDYTSISFQESLSALGDVQIEAYTSETGTVNPGDSIFARLDGYSAVTGTDNAIHQSFIEYLDDNNNAVARMWLMTPEALRFRMDRGTMFALGGVGINDLMSGGLASGIYQTLLNYKLGLPVQSRPQELALRWSIESADGLVDEVFTGLNDQLVATINAPDGNYAINVEVVSGDAGEGALRGGAAVAVFAPTATPTPEPTATPTPTPAPTNTPNRAAEVVQPPSGGGAPAVQPVSGSIVGGTFEYGGHVTSTGTGGLGAMQRAGMNWMKIQLRYAPGMDPGAAAGPISEAHSRGMKILLGVVGYPNDLAAGGEGYVQGFASFLGGVAAHGPDAIEVWNEPNIDREWPAGQISGSGYANMLRQAYGAIKSANGGVMVISGAPAPTGAEAAYPGRVMNDDRWISELIAAGGVQWMDCLGVHYNEGIIAPSQRSGDPRDGYYTRYFYGMMDTYWNAIGGQRPLCFTELGYLSSEGYPPLDPYFGWAANVTVAQHAAWLAEAAALSSQSGRVRLLIVWNVDFTNYGADPMAGYAMIRPGGGCPACEALAGAR